MMKLLRTLLLLTSLPFVAFAAPTTPFVAGKDYQVITTPLPSDITILSTDQNGQIARNSVIEFFNPGCPACFHTEPAVENWLKNKPSRITFARVPIVFHKEWEIYARAYYTAVGLNNQDTMVPILFNTIHGPNTQAAQALSDPQGIIAIFVANNPTLTTPQAKANYQTVVTATFNSLVIDSQLQQAKELMTTYQVFEIPTMLVGGKYLVSGSMAKSPERMMQIVNYLIKTKFPATPKGSTNHPMPKPANDGQVAAMGSN